MSICFSVIFILIIWVFNFVTSHRGSYSSCLHDYQYLRRNDESLSTNYGIVSYPNIIKENEYISYRDDQGNNILVSNFGDIEYECFGFCFCDENNNNEERKTTTSTNIMSKRVFSYLLVSISSIMAYKKAKSFFEKRCLKELSKDEQCHHIKSTVEECSPIINTKGKEKEKEEEESISFNKLGREKGERRVYFCYGNCVTSGYYKYKESTVKQFKKIQCEKLKKEGEVEVFESDLIRKTTLTSSNSLANNFYHTARNKFTERFLVDFCRKESRIHYYFESSPEKIKGTKKLYQRKKKRKIGSGCVARKVKKSQENVRCRQIDPSPSNVNWKWILQRFNKDKEKWDSI